MDAVAVGDKDVWERHVADDLIYTDENRRVLTKGEILADFRPLPKGYTGSIKVAEVRSRINGDGDAGGRVTMMLDRRENNDLVWKRIK